MSSLVDLAKMNGVILAFEFTPNGRLRRYETNAGISPEMAATAVQFCASVTMNFNTLADAFSKLSNMCWTPQQGWAYSGGEYSVVLGGSGYRGVFIRTANADFNALFEMLVGYPPADA